MPTNTVTINSATTEIDNSGRDYGETSGNYGSAEYGSGDYGSGEYGSGDYGQTSGTTYPNYGTIYPPINEGPAGNGGLSGNESSREANYVQLLGGSGLHEGNLFLNESLVCLDDSQQGLEVAQVVCRFLSPCF